MSGFLATQAQSAVKPTFSPARSGLLQRACACGQHTSNSGGECEECRKKRQGTVQRAAVNNAPTTEVPPIVYEVLQAPGQPLEAETQAFMEPRFGRDFSRIALRENLVVGDPHDQYEQEADKVANDIVTSEPALHGTHDFRQVRLHTDAKAAESARAVNAQAYTVGTDIVFASGQYAPRTNRGQHLLAHELTHCLQQQTLTPRLQRTLAVNPNHPTLAPATDPAAILTTAQRFAMMDSLIQSLCNQFEVDQTNGEVRAKTLQSLDPTALATGTNPTGCCCLNVLTSAATNWTIQVSQVVGPQTHFMTHQVFLSPTNTPVEFGSFTATGSLAFQGAVPAAGHELCGHAALEELSAHPPPQNRTTTNVHDPTVRIENLISTEQGVPAAQLRGLAGSGVHRGESVDRITIRDYQFNDSNVPSSEMNKLQFAAAYIRQNDSFVDVIGHSDNVGSSSAKQSVSDQRALKAKAALTANGVPTTISTSGLTGVSRFTRVEGVTDTQPPPPPLNTNQVNWRRVDILVAGFPAGAQHPPSGTPTGVSPHIQSSAVPARKTSADACVRLLVGGAYP